MFWLWILCLAWLSPEVLLPNAAANEAAVELQNFIEFCDRYCPFQPASMTWPLALSYLRIIGKLRV